MSSAAFMFVAILKSGPDTQEAVGCLNLLARALGIQGWTGESSVYFRFFFLSHTFVFLCDFFFKLHKNLSDLSSPNNDGLSFVTRPSPSQADYV